MNAEKALNKLNLYVGPITGRAYSEIKNILEELGKPNADLLEACEAAMEALSPTGHFPYRADRSAAIGDAYNKLTAAIAKAKEG